MVKLIVVSNVVANFEFTVEESMTVGETALLLSEMHREEHQSPDSIQLKLTFKGAHLSKADETWGNLNPKEGDKLFVFVTAVPHARGGYAAQPTIGNIANRKENDDRDRKQYEAMAPFLDAMANNPATVDMLIAQSPELKRMIERHPEMERELRDPETLKMMLRSQMDPDARRQMDTSMQSTLAQLNSIPGGNQLLESAAAGLLQDTPAPRTAADLKEASEENATPKDGAGPNVQALPNPWRRSAQQPQFPAASGGFPMMNNMFGMGFPPMMPTPAMAGTPQQQQPSDDESRQMYSSQLALLREMGFDNEALMLEALRASNGDVDAAVNYIADRM